MKKITEPAHGLQFECSGRIIDSDINEISLTHCRTQLTASGSLVSVYNKEHDWFETNVELTAEEKKELAADMIIMWANFGKIKITF